MSAVVNANLAVWLATITSLSKAPLGSLSILIVPEVIFEASSPLAVFIPIICPFSSLVIEFMIVPAVIVPPSGV